MKEKIYTIPINEAVECGSECPFCIIADRLERESVDYMLGAAMMEPDYRCLCNEKGFCRRHGDMLFKKPNKLSLALILDTRTEELKKQLSLAAARQKKRERARFGRKKEKKEPPADRMSCVICEKIDATLERYAEVFFHMWKEDGDFRGRIEKSKGFCMPHYYFLTESAKRYLKTPDEFITFALEKQITELERLGEDIHRFTLKFDYRNKDMEWGRAKDAPARAMQKLSGCTEAED